MSTGHIHFDIDTSDTSFYRDHGSWMLQGRMRVNADRWILGFAEPTVGKTFEEIEAYERSSLAKGLEPMHFTEVFEIPVAVVGVDGVAALLLFPNGDSARIRVCSADGGLAIVMVDGGGEVTEVTEEVKIAKAELMRRSYSCDHVAL